MLRLLSAKSLTTYAKYCKEADVQYVSFVKLGNSRKKALTTNFKMNGLAEIALFC